MKWHWLLVNRDTRIQYLVTCSRTNELTLTDNNYWLSEESSGPKHEARIHILV